MSTVRDALLTFARCCGLGERSAVYVSTPITTGQSYLDWRRRDPGLHESHPRYASDHREQVVRGNLDRAREVVRAVRAAFAGPVIDPTLLCEVDGWGQVDYRSFWATVVERFAHTVVFVDGWQYSTGCAVEFETAARHRLTLLDERLRPLDPWLAVELLTSSSGELAAAGLDVSVLSAAAARAGAAIGPAARPR